MTLWLKDQLEDAWRREAQLKKMIKAVGETKFDSLTIQIQAMER